MYLGRIVEIAPSDELYRNPAHPYTRLLLASIPVPDPEVEDVKEMSALEIESVADDMRGCRFCARCPERADRICDSDDPRLTEISKGHMVACHAQAGNPIHTRDAMFDLLIRNGMVVDGSGTDGFHADIGIRGDRIAAIGNLKDAEARSVIDARDHVVAPGFIDPHTHTDFTILQDPFCNSKIRQGVTTEVAGNCGFSLFPMRPEKLSLVKSYVGFMPGALDWDWGGYEDIAALLRRTGTAGNFASLVGHGMARIMAMDFSSGKPGKGELSVMSELIGEALAQGAVGLSLGLAYPPGSYAEAEELTALAHVAHGHPKAVLTAHLRDEGDGVVRSVDEILKVARATGVPVHISHHKATGPANWGKVGETMEMMAAAARDGLDVTFDVYPYTAGNTTIVSLFPKWSMDKGVGGLIERLTSERDRIAREMQAQAKRVGGWERIVVATVKTDENKRFEGKSIAEIAERAEGGRSLRDHRSLQGRARGGQCPPLLH